MSDNITALSAGTFTRKKADKKTLINIAFGFYISKELNRSDAGQTIVCKNKTIMAVQSYESRLETIRRGGLLSNKKAVIIITGKVSIADNEEKPCINIKLFEEANKTGGNIIAIESEKVFIEDIESCIKYADRNKMVLISFNENDILKYVKGS